MTSTLDPGILRSAPPVRATPQGQPIPTRSPVWEDAAAIERLRQEQGARAKNPQLPPEDVAPVEVAPEPASVTPEPVAAPVIDPQPSQFHANGEAKSPAFRGAEKTAQNTTAKAKRFADKLHEGAITAEMADQIQAGMVSESQMGSGAAPRWGNFAERFGETEPKSSVEQIIAELKRLEAGKEAATKPSEVSSQPAKSTREVKSREARKFLGVPEDTPQAEVTRLLSERLAEAMESEKPKAAAAGKGKK